MSKVNNTVGSVLEGRTLIVLAAEQTVREAAGILSQHGIGAAPVLSGQQLLGVFTERDVLKRVVAAGRDPNVARVGEVMTADPQTTRPETPLVTAFAMMIDGNFRHLPVVADDGRVLAMLSMRDVPPEHRIMHRQWSDWTGGTNGRTPPAGQA